MSLSTMRRLDIDPALATISATVGDATPIGIQGVTSGTIHITTASVTPVDVSVYVASGPNGTYRPLYDRYGAPVVIPGVDDGRAYDVPGEAFGSPTMKLVAASGSDFAAQVTFKA